MLAEERMISRNHCALCAACMESEVHPPPSKLIDFANTKYSRVLRNIIRGPSVRAAVQLSDDHKPNRTDERSRIEAAGGVVVWAGTWRVGGVLAVSRAFGDRLLKRYVVSCECPSLAVALLLCAARDLRGIVLVNGWWMTASLACGQ